MNLATTFVVAPLVATGTFILGANTLTAIFPTYIDSEPTYSFPTKKYNTPTYAVRSVYSSQSYIAASKGETVTEAFQPEAGLVCQKKIIATTLLLVPFVRQQEYCRPLIDSDFPEMNAVINEVTKRHGYAYPPNKIIYASTTTYRPFERGSGYVAPTIKPR